MFDTVAIFALLVVVVFSDITCAYDLLFGYVDWIELDSIYGGAGWTCSLDV